MGELSSSSARDSAFFVFYSATAKYERRACTSSLRNPTLADQIHRELMSAHDEPLSVAMCGLLVLLVAVENGCN
jgi:hypothetical protein